MNLNLYNKVRIVPDEAKKEIKGGRLGGMTDINPMWRIKTLTEYFGLCGFGWKYVITKQWTEEGADGVISAFCNIDLYIKDNGQWSDAIPGTGGSSFIAKEKSGLYTSDECFKMALTDAISVACKSLGIGADVYWQKDRTKYNTNEEEPKKISETQAKALETRLNKLNGLTDILTYFNLKSIKEADTQQLSKINAWCNKKEESNQQSNQKGA